MKNVLKRLLSVMLVLSLVGAMLPAVYAQDNSVSENEPVVLTDADYVAADAVFDRIDAMENTPAKKNATQTQLSEAAEALVLASDNYVEGSLERNGDSFTWWTEDGIHCVYSPYMRRLHSEMTAPESPLADGAYNEPVVKKGGWPSNNEVYLIGPYYGHDSNFTNQYKNEAKSVAAAIGDSDGYTLYSGTGATLDKIAEAVSNGAVVFFDSHGDTDYAKGNDYVTGATTSYLCLTSTTGLTNEDYDDGALYYSDGICINGATIANHMTKDSPGGIVWMAICLGMATDGLYAPLREKGVEVVYGYSQSVSFGGDYLWEDVFWDNMCDGETVATAITQMKSRYGEWDCAPQMYEYGDLTYAEYGSPVTSISEARDYYYAFPIVVSDEDEHPGQRKGSSFYGADSLQTVKSTYTLFSQYEVTALSNNRNYGTVSVSGNTITAVPAEGYFAEGATVLSGNATVNQNGNKFTVRADSDCTVQINFAPKTAVTVSFSGATVESRNGYAGDAMRLPVAEAPEDYTFLGWMTAPLSQDTTEKPTFYTDTFTPTASTVLYALYSYVEEGSGTGTGDYVKVTATPDDWSGEYVIVYESGKLILDGSLTTLDAKGNVQSVTITNNTISVDAVDLYKFTIAKSGSGYSIQSASGKYIGGTSGSNTLTSNASAVVNKISLDASGNAMIVSNGSTLQYNASDNRFRYYKSANQEDIALYLKDGSVGTTCYTSNPTKCEHSSTAEIAAVAATCTQSGFTAGVQCKDCGSYISGHEPVAALGHSWGDWAQTTAPNCTAAGEQIRTCGTCGVTETETIPATGHSMDNGKITTAATCTTAGVMTYTCGACGTTETQAIAATGHNYVIADGTYTCTSCGDSYEAPVVSSLHYVFSTYTAGTQYAEGEVHALDDMVTLTINGAHLNTQIRLYAGSNAVFSCANAVDSIIVKAGYKADTLSVYGSTDGENWTFIKAQSTITSYTNYTIDMPDGTAYTYVMLESNAAQIRVSEMTINFLTSGSTDTEEPTDPSEPEETEPTEPDENEPTEPEKPEAGTVTSLQYVFKEYPSGAAGATGEQHVLDDVVTLTINDGYLTDTLRIYSGKNVEFTSTKVIDSIIVNAGYKAATLNVYGSVDGGIWTLIQAQSVTSAYAKYTIDMPADTAYTHLKLEASGAQIRINEMTINVVEPGGETTEPKVDTWNITLGDDLKVNFYADIPARYLESTVIRVRVAGATTEYSNLTADSNGQYPLSVTLAAAQMTEQITLEIVVDGKQISAQTYSIRQYADSVLADESKSSCHALVKEMLNYGAMAQTYFGHNTGDLANAGITGVAATGIPATAAQEMAVTGKLEGIRFYGASLVYQNKIALRFYFKVTGDIAGYSFGGHTPVKSGTLYYVEVAEISPAALDTQITLAVTDADGNTLSVSYSPMNYMVRMHAKGSDSLKALLKAMYNYHLAAKAYTVSG